MTTIHHKCAISAVAVAMAFVNLFEPAALGSPSNQSKSKESAAVQASAGFEKALRRFLELAPTNRKVSELLVKHHIMLQYSIKDLSLDWYLGLEGGKVVSALGGPSRPSKVVIASKAGTLEKYLKGQNCGSDEWEVVKSPGLLGGGPALRRDLPEIQRAFSKVYLLAVSTLETSQLESPSIAKH